MQAPHTNSSLQNSAQPSIDPVEAEAAREYSYVACNCEQHGPYSAYRSVDATAAQAMDCPKCIDDVDAKHKAQRRARDDQQMRSRKLKEIYGNSGIPARFAERTLEGYSTVLPGQRFAQMICKTYAETWTEQYRKGGSLVLSGNVGTGKTHLACAIANAVIPEHLATVAFGTVAKLVRSVRSTYGGKSAKNEQQAIDDLVRPDLLIVDEIGVQNGSDHELAMLFEIFNERAQNLKPTIIISNLNAADLEKFLGVRVMDRFRECGTVVPFAWESHRGKQALL